MSRVIYKYPLPATDAKYSLDLPIGWKFLRVAFQNDKLCLWAEVDDVAEKKKVNFVLVGTGHDIPPAATYLTTYDLGPLVLHIYLV